MATTPRYRTFLGCLSLLALTLRATEPITLQPWPQKFRTLYSLNDPHIPPSLLNTTRTKATASDGATWFASSNALIRFDPHANRKDQLQYFAGPRYLPDGNVLHIMSDGKSGVWVRTSTGVSHIELRPLTLAAKADLFEDRIRLRHNRHGLVSPSTLRTPGILSSSQTRDDDNDGLWTSMYAAAECFRYAVTKSPEALENARRATKAVLFLEHVTGIPGFPARSFIVKGESMPAGGEWHWTSSGQYFWKSDTSSDEIVGHMFLYSIAYDLLPDESLKNEIAATAARIMDHILSHGYYLVGPSGKPTRWGRWSPEYFATEQDDSPLNSLELLSFLETTEHVTHNPRYVAEYRKAAISLGYAALTTRYLDFPGDINYSDEELAMLSFYSLFRYDEMFRSSKGDADLKARFFSRALNEWWKNEQREDNPLWTLIYLSALPNASANLSAAAHTLYRMPIDLVDWPVHNSLRNDIPMDSTRDRFALPQSTILLPPDELPVMKWNGNPFVIDSSSQASSEDDGTAFLLPYWLGRFTGLLLGE